MRRPMANCDESQAEESDYAEDPEQRHRRCCHRSRGAVTHNCLSGVFTTSMLIPLNTTALERSRCRPLIPGRPRLEPQPFGGW